MKSDDFPNGLLHEFVAKAKKANKPSDASAIIKLEVELDKLQLKGARDFLMTLPECSASMRSRRLTRSYAC